MPEAHFGNDGYDDNSAFFSIFFNCGRLISVLTDPIPINNIVGYKIIFIVSDFFSIFFNLWQAHFGIDGSRDNSASAEEDPELHEVRVRVCVLLSLSLSLSISLSIHTHTYIYINNTKYIYTIIYIIYVHMYSGTDCQCHCTYVKYIHKLHASWLRVYVCIYTVALTCENFCHRPCHGLCGTLRPRLSCR